MRGTSNAPTVVAELDFVRLRRERHAKLQAAMSAQDVDALVLLGSGNVQYATGATWMTADEMRLHHEPTIAVVVAGDDAPHLFTSFPEGAPAELPSDHLHGSLVPEFDEGVARLADAVRDLAGAAGRVGVDEYSVPMLRGLPGALPSVDLVDPMPVLGAAKICKTADELECIRRAQRINETAMYDVQASLAPGVRQSDLSGLFLRRIFELGASSNVIDPIWEVIPSRLADGPYTPNGDLAFPVPTTDRILRDGDVLFVDTGLTYHGYASDFGRTWIVGDRMPTARQRDAYRRWRDVIDHVLAAIRPGATALDMVEAAPLVDGRRPWLRHFYLGHGIGTESAEMPLVGSDLGDAFDETVVLAPGMVIVLEPVIWDDGHGGYRAEDIVAVTDDGYRMLSDYPYDPYEE